jgi:tetratricopeptide (TPR) repeat protein
MFNSNDYPKDKVYRAQIMREAENNRLAQLTQSNSTARFSRQPTDRKLVMIVVLSVLFALLLLALPQISHAEDFADAGQVEPFADAISAYRVGYFYFTQGNYQRATAELTTAVKGIPEEIFAASIDYAVMYWTLGDAQLMAGQYEAALASYEHYLELAGEDVSSQAVEYVETLNAAVINGTAANVSLMQG